MRYLAAFFFTLLFAHNVFADNLCDASCELTITFPDGGSIEAVEALTFTFGDGGLMDDGIVATGYAAGNTMVMLAGESITFGAGGLLTLGTGGNISYTDMRFTTTGGASIKAVGGTRTITIANLVISGGLNITLDAINIVVNGILSLEPDGTLNLIADTGAIDPDVCSIQDPAAGTLTLSSSTPIVTTGTCSNIATTLSISPVVLTVGTIDPNATLTATGTLIGTGSITLTPTMGGGGVITLEPQALTQELLLTFPDGTDLQTDDGNTCTLTAGECVAATGAKYVVVDGKLVPEASSEGNGALGWFLLLLASCLAFCRNVGVPRCAF